MKRELIFLTTLTVVLALFVILPAQAKTLFEDDFSAGMGNWDIVDPGKAEIKTDNSAPAGYGPKVLFMTEPGSDRDLMAFAKGVTVTDGFYEILWKDVGLPEDTDGPMWLRGQDAQGGPQSGSGYLVELDTDTGLHIGVIIKISSVLYQNYPNPFNPETWIPYQLGFSSSSVVITIYDLSGQVVRVLDMGYRSAGAYLSQEKAAYWDGRSSSGEEVSSGIYFYQIQAAEFRSIRKMILIR